MHYGPQKRNILLFRKICPERHKSQGEKKRCFYPITFLDCFDKRDAEKDDEYRKVREWWGFHTLIPSLASVCIP